MKIRRFHAGDVESIARLNARLRSANVPDVVYGEGAEQFRNSAVRERMFVAEDGDEIRGAVWLREQAFRVRGEDVLCGWLKYPIAESLADARYAGVPASLIIHCMREQPRLFALGLGGHQTPLARMLKALRWTGTTVPMLVRPVRIGRVLRLAPAVRTTSVRRAAADALAWTGAGALANGARDVLTGARRRRHPGPYAAERCVALSTWADDLWRLVRDRYPFSAARDATTVESLLPEVPDITRLRVRHHGRDIGWACVVRHDFSTGRPDRHFGPLTVGLLADMLAAPEHAGGVLAASIRYLEDLGVDITISNQMHAIWREGLVRVGFLPAPSNFAFYAAPAAVKLVGKDWNQCHVNRGDCDGPVWYGAGH
jgi:hypothetical protein